MLDDLEETTISEEERMSQAEPAPQKTKAQQQKKDPETGDTRSV